MATQQNQIEVEFPPTLDLCLSELSISTSTSSSSSSGAPRIQLDLLTLPQFNVTYISRCLTVNERLCIMPSIHRRFRNFVLHPQCFQDMSFFPVHDDQMYEPKIISSNGNYGITYVEINIFSKHAFVERVALLAGMWNFKCNLWHQIDWPKNINIESLQLTLDFNSCSMSKVHLDEAPKLLLNASHIQINQERDEQGMELEIERERVGVHLKDCISPTTRKAMDFKYRLRNLFFIRSDSSINSPQIIFPKCLWGLGLQQFTTSIFSQNWWIKQICVEQIFENLRFLVLSCCDFSNNELEILLNACKNIEHLSMRYVRWDGHIYFPSTLLSLGYFPDRQTDGYYSLKRATKLWQISTRCNENDEASIHFLNECRKLNSIKRVKFEYIRVEGYNENDFNFNDLQKWDNDNDDLQIVIGDEELNHYPVLHEIFQIKSSKNIINPNIAHFMDCPHWSDESKDFIHMTDKRKLLLR